MKLTIPPSLFLSIITGIILISGCTGVDPTTIAKSNEMIKQFLNEHPNAKIVATHFSANQSGTMIDQIRKDCDNPGIEEKEFYRVTITDTETNLFAIVWIDWKSQTVECAIKKTTSQTPSGGGGGGGTTTNGTIPSGGGGGGGPIINETPSGGGGGAGGGTTQNKYPDYLIEENIGENVYGDSYFNFSDSNEVTHEYEIDGNPGKGYRAVYINYDERKPGFEGKGCTCSTVNGRLSCTYNGEDCNGKPYYAEVWVYSTTNGIKESLERDMFKRMFIEDETYGVYMNPGELVGLSRLLDSNVIYSVTFDPYRDNSFNSWTSGNKIIRIQGYPPRILEAYLNKFPSDFEPVIQCYDTDGGKDYYKEGYAYVRKIDSGGGSSDSCTGSVLDERYCENGEIKIDEFTCPGTCNPQKAICEEAKIKPTVTITEPSIDGGWITLNEMPIRAVTDVASICQIRLTVTQVGGGGQTPWRQMTETGGKSHYELLKNLQDNSTYKTEIKCSNSIGDSNIAERNFEVRLEKPDYMINDVVYSPDNPKVGDILYFHGVIYNNGPGGLYAGAMENGCEIVYPSGEKRGGGGSGTGQIEPGKTKVTGDCGYPLTEAGNYTLTIIADSSNWITETNEDNNNLSKTVMVS